MPVCDPWTLSKNCPIARPIKLSRKPRVSRKSKTKQDFKEARKVTKVWRIFAETLTKFLSTLKFAAKVLHFFAQFARLMRRNCSAECINHLFSLSQQACVAGVKFSRGGGKFHFFIKNLQQFCETIWQPCDGFLWRSRRVFAPFYRRLPKKFCGQFGRFCSFFVFDEFFFPFGRRCLGLPGMRREKRCSKLPKIAKYVNDR